ncbi:MAG: sulfatase [Pirellulales bacterium]
MNSIACNLFTALSVMAFALMFTVPSVQAEADTRPNIIVIMADDFGWMDVHYQGNKDLDTPELDRLATQGMQFTDAYAAAPVCSPTRAAMMTGQSPARLALTNHAAGHPDGFYPKGSKLAEAEWVRHLSLDYVTLAERLKQAGYATGFVGKWHLSHKPGSDDQGKYEPRLRPEHQGFDVNIAGNSYGGPPSYFAPYRLPNLEDGPKGEYLPGRLADEAIKFMKDNQDGPFFLSWWNYSVHYPFQAPEKLVKKYEERLKGTGKNHIYYAMIEGMDSAIGRVLKAVDDLGIADNTLLIFNSDNGALGNNNQPLRSGKGHLYEGGIRVPWIVRWPGVVKPGTTNAVPVISMDTFPTILEAAGVQLESDYILDGESLLPLVKQTGKLQRNAIYFHYPNYAFHKQNRLGGAIRRGNYKLIKFYDDNSIELYDLSNDIGEKKNLANNKPKVAKRLQQQLEQWLLDNNAKMPVPVQ